jgi:hypothetical protein
VDFAGLAGIYRNQVMRRLAKEERLLAAVAAHFLLVLDVVAADAEDAPNGEQVLGVLDRKGRDVPQRDYVCHSMLSWKEAEF